MMRVPVVVPGSVPGIHVFLCLIQAKTGMAGIAGKSAQDGADKSTQSAQDWLPRPAMTAASRCDNGLVQWH
jgi:hypothetical protein